ncbi:acyl-CoA dehydrogenase family protein [Amycolatopsis aidingensis]|uniref:acyl-CoA dehydrogenase family protein n=1 Tax=Amycolatopsis aidingensis TaxID=2842453 RepID=UPI001C0BD124|nr:acyl-CoA dehydrogenase family protein [Amycolatopsis aidingensis]
MDFTLDENQRAVADLAAEVLAKELDTERALGEHGYDERLWRALAKAGLLSLALPAELGGDDLGLAEVAVLLAELGRAAAPVPALATLALGVLPVNELGAPAQRADVLPGVAAGEDVLTAALHEPSAPLTSSPATTASSSGGRWVLSGTKIAVPFAATATRILVPATMPGGIGVFLLHPATEGVSLVPAGNEGTLLLDRAPVADADLLGSHRGGEALAVLHRCALAGAVAFGDGVLAGALRLTTEHLGARQQFGRPLATFQAVAQQVADVYVAARTVHLAATSAVWRLATGRDPEPDLGIAAYWLAEEAPRALAACHHLHGGLGLDVTYPLHHYYALAKSLARDVGGARARLDRLGDLVAG